MLTTKFNGTQAITVINFSLRRTAETLANLPHPIDTIARHLHHRAPCWCWEVQSVQEVGGAVIAYGPSDHPERGWRPPPLIGGRIRTAGVDIQGTCC